MVTGRSTRKAFTLVEKSTPNRARVETGLRLLGRIIAQAYVRDGTTPYANTNGHHEPALNPQEEEIRDSAGQ